MLICQKHLKECYGLELGYHLDDHPTNVAWVGGFLRPVKNFAYFKRNTVIIPTKKFFDVTQRPEEYRDESNKFRKYQMNPIILDYVRKYGMNAGKNLENRLTIEMYRNMMHDNVDPGPRIETHLSNLSTIIRGKKAISQSFIMDQVTYNCFKDFAIYHDDKYTSLIDIPDMSIAMQYILFNCIFSIMKITDDENYYSDYLPYNCEYVPTVGLVATELINHPHYLVINGMGIGSQIYYNAFVSFVQKEVLHKNYTLKDIPSQYALTNALKSGTMC